MKFFRQSLIVLSSILASLLSFVGSANSDGHGEFKLGVVTFLSGPAGTFWCSCLERGKALY